MRPARASRLRRDPWRDRAIRSIRRRPAGRAKASSAAAERSSTSSDGAALGQRGCRPLTGMATCRQRRHGRTPAAFRTETAGGPGCRRDHVSAEGHAAESRASDKLQAVMGSWRGVCRRTRDSRSFVIYRCLHPLGRLDLRPSTSIPPPSTMAAGVKPADLAPKCDLAVVRRKPDQAAVRSLGLHQQRAAHSGRASDEGGPPLASAIGQRGDKPSETSAAAMAWSCSAARWVLFGKRTAATAVGDLDLPDRRQAKAASPVVPLTAIIARFRARPAPSGPRGPSPVPSGSP